MPLDGKYRSVGEAYVKFTSTAEVDKAMAKKHKEKIKHRLEIHFVLHTWLFSLMLMHFICSVCFFFRLVGTEMGFAKRDYVVEDF